MDKMWVYKDRTSASSSTASNDQSLQDKVHSRWWGDDVVKSRSLHQSPVFIHVTVTLLLASVPFDPVLLSLHLCEPGNGALECEDFLLSSEHGEACRVLRADRADKVSPSENRSLQTQAEKTFWLIYLDLFFFPMGNLLNKTKVLTDLNWSNR